MMLHGEMMIRKNLLDILEKHDIKVTFFYDWELGRQISGGM